MAALLFVIGGCASLPKGYVGGPAVSKLGITEESAARALAVFSVSCTGLLRRGDTLFQADWGDACIRASLTASPKSFFEQNFRSVRVGDGSALITGYYEPEIAGSRIRMPGYDTPVYRLPPEAERRVDRAAIEDGVLDGQGLEIAWAADPIEVFFLQIQGSGRLLLPDGSVLRIGYAGQNGFPYAAIGKQMRERGLIVAGQLSMQGIMAWLRTHPDEGRGLMRENASYVFFRELTGPGPVGAMGVPVTPRASVAADPAFVPLGAPVFLKVDRPEANGLWVAQDTGGAIKGANRFDSFWGAGDEARTIAGGMSARGKAWLLIPKRRAGHASPRR